jgi:hypothetical protein
MDLTCWCVLFLVSLMPGSVRTGGTAKQSLLEPVVATVCDLQALPDKYRGKIVEVRASVVGRKKLTIFDFDSPGCLGQLTVVFPQALKSPPGFSLLKDADFEIFSNALRERTDIQATFEGRFDYSPERREREHTRTGSMRLVLRQVRDIKIRKTRSVDR